jgi:hypothetical protein
MSEYVYQPVRTLADFDTAADVLSRRVPQPIVRQWVDYTNPDGIATVVERLRGHGVAVEPLPVDAARWRRYAEDAGYKGRYPHYYPTNWIEKSLEHLLSLETLQLDRDQVFIDVASEGSPLPEIATRLAGSRSFAQDIMYEPGIHGSRIGGDATSMPVPDGFANGVCLTCSLEHFEGDADTRLFTELSRVLAPGGRVVIVPLYIAPIAAIQTDPLVSHSLDLAFDDEATIFCAKGWGNRHGRFYSPETLIRRIIAPHADLFDFTVRPLVGAGDVDPSVYARFLLDARRR